MAGPSWLTGAFAGVMILTACYSASRLVVSRRRGLATEADADGLHTVMGAAMAGMLVPSLNVLPATTWMVVFGSGAAWFGACAARSQSQARFSWQCRYPVPHLIECIAMLYMLLAVRGARRGTGMAMPGMGTSPGTSAAFPALAVVLALFMLGYVMWATDQLASLARAKITTTIPARIPEQRALAAVTSARPCRQHRRNIGGTARLHESGFPHAQTRRVRQDRDGHHYGLYADPHGLIRLRGTTGGPKPYVAESELRIRAW